MAPLKELDVNRVHSRPASQKKGSKKLLSKSPSMEEGPTLEAAARSMTEKLKRKRGSNEAERDDEAVQETDLELTQQPPQSAQMPKNGSKTPRAKKAKTGKDDKNDDTNRPSSPKEQPSKSAASSKDNSKSKSTSTSTSKNKDLKGMDDKYDVSSVELPGETNGTVPIYDTCADIRTKIQTHLRTTSQPQAAFARMIHQPQHNEKPISSALVKRFLDKKGPSSGNTSPVFYAAYVYFEKVRVKANRKKTKKREEMEKAWGKGGFDTEIERGGNQRMLLHASESAYEDKYGRMHIVRDGKDEVLS